MKKKLIAFSFLWSALLIGCSSQPNSSSNSQISSSLPSESTSESIPKEESSLSTQESSSESVSESSSEQTIPEYMIHGLFQGEAEWTDKVMQKNPSSATEYFIQGITLYENDLFKIHMGDTWYGYSDLKSSVPSGLVDRGATNDNIKVVASGIYDIYCDSKKSDGGYIYLNKMSEIDPGVVHVSSISLNRSGVFMVMGGRFYLEATISPSNATNQEITWTSGNPDVAVVANTGWVSGVSKGKTTITATTKDGNKTASCMVFVNDTEEPMYYLIGTIGGQAIEVGNYLYAAIPDTGSKFIIPDVELFEGDEIHVYNPDRGKTLKDSMGREYVVNITEHRYVDIYLDILSAVKNYLSFVDK